MHDPMGVPRVPIDVRMRIGTKFSGIPQELRSIPFRSGPSGGIPQERTTLAVVHHVSLRYRARVA